MADPRRLLDDPELSPLGRAALTAGSDDAPDDARRRDIARKVGIAAGLGVLTTGATEASAVAWWKVVAVVVALGAGGVAVVKSVRSDEKRAEVVAPAVEETRGGPRTTDHGPRPEEIRAPAPTVVAVAPTVPVAPVVQPPPKPERHPTHQKVESPPAPKAPEPEAQSPKPEAPAEPQAEPAPIDPAPQAPAPQIDARRLAAEVALLDRARAAVTAHDPTAALAALDEHHATFGSDGALLAEADLVRIEALLAAGRRAEASSLGSAFLSRYPRSPLAKRVRSLLAR